MDLIANGFCSIHRVCIMKQAIIEASKAACRKSSHVERRPWKPRIQFDEKFSGGAGSRPGMNRAVTQDSGFFSSCRNEIQPWNDSSGAIPGGPGSERGKGRVMGTEFVKSRLGPALRPDTVVGPELPWATSLVTMQTPALKQTEHRLVSWRLQAVLLIETSYQNQENHEVPWKGDLPEACCA